MTAQEVAVRAEMARKFLDVAQIVADDDSDDSLPAVAGSLGVLAGIAASDAICGHVLEQRPRGQDHAQAVTVPEGVRDAQDGASALRRLLADNVSHDGTTYLSSERARSMVRRAQTVLTVMERLLGSPR